MLVLAAEIGLLIPIDRGASRWLSEEEQSSEGWKVVYDLQLEAYFYFDFSTGTTEYNII